jgi:hypothetical protein
MKALIFLSTLFLGGCAHSIHLVHAGGFDHSSSKGAKMIEARSEQFAVMGFVFDTNYVDQAYSKLQDECRGGNIEGVVTQYSTSLGFFSWTHKILMRGWCFSSNKSA